jgi:beta-glucosidase
MVRRHKLSENTVNEAVLRILRMKYQVGLFEDPYHYHNARRENENILTAEHRQAAREVARESIVLLKNEKDVLPLSKEMKNLAVIGALAGDNHTPLGSWHGVGKINDVINVLQGIEKAVSKNTEIVYAPAYDVDTFSDRGIDTAVKTAQQADMVILALGERANMSGEANNRASIELPGIQQELAKKIYATGKPIVVILINGRPLAIPWLADNVPTILETWFLGIEMGNAVADVLFGDYNPSGKLPVTFPRATGQIPIYYNHKNTGRPPAEDNHYSSKYLDLPWTPQFPFGFGLRYTKFEYSSLILDAQEMDMQGKLKVAVAVKNSGSLPGDEVVQLYIQDVVASVTRPVKQLCCFKKIHLDPMEEKMVRFELSSDDLAFYNLEMKKTVEPGLFRIFVGGNSQDVLESEFKVVK